MRATLKTRALAAAMAAASLIAIRPIHADPADIFSIAAPTPEAGAPKASDVHSGDVSVSPTGAMEYSYPIATPPGRNGMQGHLALSYSSQGPIYGELAAGWSLGIPIISEDTSRGRLRQAGSGIKEYKSSLAGGRPLVAVSEPAPSGYATYRAQNDASFTRYQRNGNVWFALTTDGLTYSFGGTTDSADHFAGCTTISAGNAPLAQISDAFGNLVDYWYEPGVVGECRIARIEWGKNVAASVDHFARIQFTYSSGPTNCGGTGYVGAQSSYRTGTNIVTGASELDTVTVTAYPPGRPTQPVHTRVVTLGYDAPTAGGTGTAACFRQLDSIQETASGIDSPSVTLPPMTFGYGAATFGRAGATGNVQWSNYNETTIPWAPGDGYVQGPSGYNLGWGYRFNSPSTWPTLEATMLDIDGDGLLDRVINQPVRDASGHIIACQAAWERNRGPGLPFDGPTRLIPLPTLRWNAESLPNNCSYASGGAYANQSVAPPDAPGYVESCSLNYQLSLYRNSHAGGQVCSTSNSCPATGYCDGSNGSPYGTDCSTNYWITHPPIYLAYRWVDVNHDGKVDLIASPVGGTEYNLQRGNGREGCGTTTVPESPPVFGTFPTCPATSNAVSGGRYTMCNGMSPWMIYLNHGNGVFGNGTMAGNNGIDNPVPDYIRYQPASLEASEADATITGVPVGSIQATLDLDGDGFVDSVTANNSLNQTDLSKWRVFRSDPTALDNHGNRLVGQFVGDANSAPFLFNVFTPHRITSSDFSTNYDPNTGTYSASDTFTTEGLLDINGDGLPDHWTSPSPTSSATFELNDGTQFITGATFSVSPRPATDGAAIVTSTIPFPHQAGFVVTGSRSDSSRTVDLDLDGRPDVSTISSPGVNASVSLGTGAGFTSATAIPAGGTGGLLHEIQVDGSAPYGPFTWAIRSDEIDLDGDGIPEGMYFLTSGTTGTMFESHAAAPVHPPRLLVSIDNHRGATTDISYAPLSNSAVVRQVNAKSPVTQWVVSSIASTEHLPTTNPTFATSSYKYADPQYLADERGQYALRGFAEIDTTLPSGAIHEARYSFSPDFSGRLASTLVVPAEDTNQVRAIDDTTWEARTLFGGALTTYHATLSDHWTCKNGQGETACRANADTRTRTTTTLTPLASTTADPVAALAWAPTQTRLLAGATPAEGDRVTDRTYAFAANTTTYHLWNQTTTRSSQVASSLVMFAKTAHTFDASYRVALTDETWFDTVDAHRAIASRVYDMATGNVLSRRKPVQQAANGPSTTYTYDDRKLFPATQVDEANLNYNFTYEYGTGTQLVRTGPDTPPCAATQTCPAGTLPVDEHMIRIDGIGRTIEKWQTVRIAGPAYKLYQTDTFAFDDASYQSAGTATSVFHQHVIDYDTNDVATGWAADKAEFDGHGRVLKQTVFAQSTAPADAITTFHYRNDGTLAEVDTPDPSANSTTTVAYTYTFDSLGRPTGLRRPDATATSEQSGADLSYDGLTKTVSEFVGAAGGSAAVTTTTTDAFGRLVRVDEKTSSSTVATTTYAYDASDAITEIDDPESGTNGVVTTMVHDFAGRRTSITRAGRTWSYGYDKNGNRISESVPCSPMPTCQASFTSTIAYDGLDRPVSKVNAPGNLSASDQALFGDATETYVWDGASISRGYLYSWKSFGPGTSNATLYVSPTFDDQGDSTGETERLTLAGLPMMTRSYFVSYRAGGALRTTNAFDTMASGNTGTEIRTDARGRPSYIYIVRSDAPPMFVGNATRNVAGLVTQQKTTFSSGAMTSLESDWTYDKLGRVTNQTVQSAPNARQIARQDLAYLGNDDPTTLDQYLGTSHKQFHYSYDLRHQLVGVTEPTTTNFAGTYTYGPAGRFTRATESIVAPASGSEVAPRDVNYQYASTDPEEVVGLNDAATGLPYATYTYDLAGNQLSRCIGRVASPCSGTSLDYVYDGKNQLRRATKKVAGVVSGSEEYWYDAEGHRDAIAKRDASGALTEVVTFTGEGEAHYNATGALQNVFTYLTSGAGPAIGRVDRNSMTSTVELDFHGLGDHTLAAVDTSSGTINASLSYAPFGEVFESTDGGGSEGLAAHRRRFNNKYHDDISGLVYYGARYLDNISMTWTQSDPEYRFTPDSAWDEPRRSNLYVFALQNSLSYEDPDGRDANQDHGKEADCAGGIDSAGCSDLDKVDPTHPLHRLSNVDHDRAQACQTDRTSPGCLDGTRTEGNGLSTTNGSRYRAPDKSGFWAKVGGVASKLYNAARTAHRILLVACAIGSDGACEVVDGIEDVVEGAAEKLVGKIVGGASASGKGPPRAKQPTMSTRYVPSSSRRTVTITSDTGNEFTITYSGPPMTETCSICGVEDSTKHAQDNRSQGMCDDCFEETSGISGR